MNTEHDAHGQPSGDDGLREAARKRIKAKREFWNLVLIFAIVSVIINAVWYFSGYRDYYWPAWPMLGFAIAIFFNALSAYGPGSRPISDDEIDREVRKLRGH